jgi:hypothetical protein
MANVVRLGNLFNARDIEPATPPERKPFAVFAPSTPGAAPSWQSEHATIEQAEDAAIKYSRNRPWLKGQDVSVRGPDGRIIVRAAGSGR